MMIMTSLKIIGINFNRELEIAPTIKRRRSMSKRYNKQGLEIRVEPYYKVPYLKNTILGIITFALYMYVIYLMLEELGRGYY